MNWDAPIKLKPCCVNLRHKMMYCDPRQSTPGLVDDQSDTRVYLCMESQEVLGPDGGTVNPRICQAGRACYQRPVLAPVTPTIDRRDDMA